MATVFLNGQFLDKDAAKVSAFDAGFQHAVGLFETMSSRVEDGRAEVFRLESHLDRLIASAAELGLSEDQYTVSFQSRLLKDPWLQPYTDEVLKTFPAKGIKKVLAYSPAFVADCLETTIEVGDEFKHMFLEAGGEKWQLVESLNSEPMWVEAVKEMVLQS